MEERIPDSVLASAFQDGEEWNAQKLNMIIAVLKKGVNQNYVDILNIETTPGPQGPEGPMPDASQIVLESGRTLQEEINYIHTLIK